MIDLNKVDLSVMPRYSRHRPDFTAPGPHVTIMKKGDLNLEEKQQAGDDDDEDYQSYTYYESDKVLGKLYRAIDEEEVFREIQQMGQPRGVSIVDRSNIVSHINVMDSLLAYVKQRCVSLNWTHFIEMAQDIREE